MAPARPCRAATCSAASPEAALRFGSARLASSVSAAASAKSPPPAAPALPAACIAKRRAVASCAQENSANCLAAVARERSCVAPSGLTSASALTMASAPAASVPALSTSKRMAQAAAPRAVDTRLTCTARAPCPRSSSAACPRSPSGASKARSARSVAAASPCRASAAWMTKGADSAAEAVPPPPADDDEDPDVSGTPSLSKCLTTSARPLAAAAARPRREASARAPTLGRHCLTVVRSPDSHAVRRGTCVRHCSSKIASAFPPPPAVDSNMAWWRWRTGSAALELKA
mmetsp:Transcript_139526/g.446445  ORF Transcript_139526/g.446445 Transcript_139526/m.446445 type:complete len:288 (-) Transcript_139526:23-886(-)